ncbi:MAG TPA: (Fe-S)-binding protein [Terriglobia bacterium]|nr:(Fe-S)-binding protein [Terriglobia bacterium]
MFPETIKEDLYRCVYCGICQQACPTFKVMRQEYYAPRGRVQIIKHYLDGDLDITPALEDVLMSCILCDACAASCVSGLRIDRLLRSMRVELDQAIPKSYDKRLLFAAVADVSRLRKAAGLARMGQKLLVDVLGTSRRLGNIPLAKFPRINETPFRQSITETVQPEGKRVGRVAYFTGCATELIYADVGRSVLQLLGRLGIEVVIPQDQVCCSAPLFLNGAVSQALPNILKNLEILDRVDVDAIVVDCATCGAALKKGIPDLLEDLGMDTERASRVAGKVRDISQIVSERLDELPIEPIRSSEPLTVTYHDPCHLVRGMGIAAEPRAIIRSLPQVKLAEMEGANECCGGGGFYQFDKVDLSRGITSRKIENIRSTGAKVVLTGCPGCRLTLAGNISESEDIEVLHTIQLLSRYLSRKSA